MVEKFGHDSFLSVFTWRYGSDEMRKVFSEVNYRAKWRQVWAALAKAQLDYGLLSRDEYTEIRKRAGTRYVNIERSQRIEKEIRHDLMAEIMTYAKQAGIGGGKIHLGATSSDIEDNADILRMREAVEIILMRTIRCLSLLAGKIRRYASTPCMGWTHLQPAEPTTLGYRFSGYAQDLILDIGAIEYLLQNVMLGKGMKGAVGTSASYSRLVGAGKSKDLEKRVMDQLGIGAYKISTQTYPRKADFAVLTGLAAIAQSLNKFALDLRILQSPPFGELSEPHSEKQVGSSAMPFKRNPIMAERVTSLARYISSLTSVALTNASNSILERTLDDSANRRIVIPEAFLALDECLILYGKILSGMKVSLKNISKNLERYGTFSLMEPMMMDLVKRGEDRQKVHEEFRIVAGRAWAEVEQGRENPMRRILADNRILQEIYGEELDRLLDPGEYLGDAPSRAEEFLAESVAPILRKYKGRVGKIRGPEY